MTLRMRLPIFIGTLTMVFGLGCRSEPAPGDAAATETTAVPPSSSPDEAPIVPTRSAPAAVGETPESVAKRYVELGARGGDLEAARALVLPRCVGHPVWEVDAARMMGARITASSVVAKLLEADEASARVTVEVKGSVKADNTRTTAEVLGKEVAIDIGGLEIGEASLSTTLSLSRTAAGWRIACP